jgi:hypothetical protein
MDPPALGTGFEASQAALEAAAEAAETMWWWDEETQNTQNQGLTHGQSPRPSGMPPDATATRLISGGGAWRTRGEIAQPGAGIKTPVVPTGATLNPEPCTLHPIAHPTPAP